MNNVTSILEKAQRSVEAAKDRVRESQWYLQYHLCPPAYWMNDPNGFCFYNGEYHLFYQHHPYAPEWGPMYWGHAKSRDLAFWEHLPIALAPDAAYDRDGCFSGSAIEKDGKLYVMYTGNVWTGENHDTDLRQVQCVAVSEDGLTFQKCAANPVIDSTPEGDIHPHHFRDPKVWKRGAFYYCVIGSRTKDDRGQVLLYRSRDLLSWEFVNVAAKGEGNFGFMWECPDLFELGGSDVLVMSPQGMKPEGDLYHNLHQSGYVIGQLDEESGVLTHGPFQLLDYGFDFYAPQTALDARGRRILIGWMAMWESDMPEKRHGWAGAMTLPRELALKNGTLVMRPVAELEKLRQGMVRYGRVSVEGETALAGVSGDCLELDVTIDARLASRFGLKLRVDEAAGQETVLAYDREQEVLIFDRNRSGEGPGGIRKAPVSLRAGQLHLRLFVDRSSVEVFINGGEKVMTGRIYPNETATGVRFFADAPIDIVELRKWHLRPCLID